jgi:peptidoglycan/LPS O-acetylase OafA/YrhL
MKQLISLLTQYFKALGNGTQKIENDLYSSAFIQKDRLLPGIRGLRGVGALAVVFYHLVHIAGIKPPVIFGFIARDFGLSVHLFFILSAFSLMYSTESRMIRSDWLLDYFIRRFFRIAPLFYCMIFLLVIYTHFPIANLKGLITVILNLTFTFGFVPAYGIGIVWAGWAVGVEMIFYAFFPVLILLIKTHRSAVIFLIISIVLSIALRSALHYEYMTTYPKPRYDWSYFSFTSNICFFAMGIYAYFVSKLFNVNDKAMRFYVPVLSLIIIGSLLLTNLGVFLYNSARFDILLWGIGLTALSVWQSQKPSIAIANPVFEFFGERSYSIYLIHPVIILLSKKYLSKIYNILFPHIDGYSYFVCAGILIFFLMIAVEFTYRAIEVPGINLGRRLIKMKSPV